MTKANRARFRSFVEDFHAQLGAHYESNPYTIGVGTCHRSLLQLSRSYQEARAALTMGFANKGSGSITYFSHMGVFSILLRQDNQKSVSRYVQRAFACLEHCDKVNRTDYLRTFKAYARNECALERTAKELFLHYNTVRYRINAIKRLFCDELFDADMEADVNMKVLCELVQFEEQRISMRMRGLRTVDEMAAAGRDFIDETQFGGRSL